ncbi:MAG: hypothetical protein HKP01_08020 [Gemmatimonadetes bacterium]|nr:hypothetical protein [Gemmatimonadota bacterium]
MKSPVSLEYVIIVALLAVTAAALSYMTPQPVFNLAALLLGVYALHLVSVRVVVRQYAGVAPRTRSRRSRQTENAQEMGRMREELELERRELDNRKAELQQRIVAAEQQWELLRQMIRDRVEGGGSLPDSVVANSPASLGVTSSSAPGKSNGSDESTRIHGRW